MERITKRALAFLLAALLALGMGTAAGAAAPAKPPQQARSTAAPVPQALPACTLVITAQPSATFVLYEDWPSLDGLVIEASGGALDGTVTVDYDTAAYDWSQAQDKINWWFGLDFDGLVVGENEITLYVEAWKCVDFIPVKTVGGVEYGYFDQELVFAANTAVTVTAEANPGYPGSHRDLALNVAETVAIGGGRYGASFKFTAPSDGFYAFKSDGGSYGETLYSIDGDVFEQAYIDPCADLYDKDFNLLSSNDDGGGNYNFALYRQMKQGEVVYLRAYGWTSLASTNYTVKATRVGETQPPLALKSNAIKVNFHDFIDIDALLESTGYDRWEVQLDFDSNYIRRWYAQPHSIKTGVTNITITAPDGAAATVKVTIGYSAAQWLCYVFLGGWAWLDYTEIGPFNLMREIRNLLDYGVGDSLRVLFSDWVYELYRWLRNY